MDAQTRANSAYWKSPYNAPHVEGWVFRPYAHIFAEELGLTGERGEKLLDFGCGEGATAGFFRRKGFDVYGVDICEHSIDVCRARMPEIADHFRPIEPDASTEETYFGGEFDLIVSIQCLYYLDDQRLRERVDSLERMMKPGGVFYATMMGTKCWYYDHSVPAERGMREVRIEKSRVEVSDYYVNFVEDEEELCQIFSPFEPLHVGHYSSKYRSDEGTGFHYTFVGRKPA